jgi:hypothetical protein
VAFGPAAGDRRAAVITSTLNPPPDELGVTHWSARLLADHLTRGGMPVSFAEVARIWRDWGLQPHRSEMFTFSTDPPLGAKIRDVVGLYLDPPTNAVVVCVDEESHTQALDRTAPLQPALRTLPLDQDHRPDPHQSQPSKEIRHGTLVPAGDAVVPRDHGAWVLRVDGRFRTPP